MKRFQDYALDVEFEAEWQQFLADRKREAERELRRQETINIIRSAVQRHRRKRKIRQCIERTVIAVVALAGGFALMVLLK